MNNSVEYTIKTTHPAGVTVTAIWLILFYLSSIWLVLGTLSARHFQDKINILIQENTEKEYTFLLITEIMTELDSNSKRRKNLQQLIVTTESEMKKLTEERHQKYKTLDEMMSGSDSLFENIKNSLIEEGLENIVQDLTVLSNLVNSLETDKKDIKAQLNRYETLMKEQGRLENNVSILETNLVSIKEQLLLYRTQNTDLFTTRTIILSNNQKIADHLNDFSYLRNMYARFLTIMPDQLLTLILTLSMGALGSVIFLTRTFLDPDKWKPLSWYLFRPFLGAVTALAIFILAKAGQITISDVSITDGIKEDLNPFFISFLAIISGLLSEQAIERIRTAGNAIFRADGFGHSSEAAINRHDRWAVRVKTELENQGKEARELNPYVTGSTKTIEDWIEEKQPVPPQSQRIIASFLGVPVRKLFSDLPPD